MELLLELVSRYSQKLAMLATIIMVVLITLLLASTAVFVLEEFNSPAVSELGAVNPVPAASQRNARRTLPVANLARLSLFGKVTERAAPVPQDAPETKLNLELQGVFTSLSSERSSAIVAQVGSEGKLYFPGDKLPGNATLSAIFDDHILLKRGERVESLKFSDDAFRSASSLNDDTELEEAEQQIDPISNRRSRPVPRRRTQDQMDPEDEERYEPEPTISAGSSDTAATLSDFVEANRDRLEQDPIGLLNDLGLSSVNAGQAEGYELGGEIPDAVLQRSGLQRGDLILSVNGQPVGNAIDDAGLVDAAMAAGRVRVEVMRGDRRFFVTVPLR